MKDIEFLREIKVKPNILVLFGSPNFGLFDIFKTQDLDLVNSVDVTINFAPNQGTQTVRVEEAIYSALSIINCVLFL